MIDWSCCSPAEEDSSPSKTVPPVPQTTIGGALGAQRSTDMFAFYSSTYKELRPTN